MSRRPTSLDLCIRLLAITCAIASLTALLLFAAGCALHALASLGFGYICGMAAWLGVHSGSRT